MGGSRQKYALISGASSGIGYELAKSFSKRGYKVFGCAPPQCVKLMEPLTEEYGVRALACDITKLDDIKTLAKVIEAETDGGLDILYNNAGICFGGPAAEIEEDLLNRIFQVNVIGHINMTKHLVGYVIKAKGRIIYTSSVAARVPLAWTAAYSATKAAIDHYALFLHGELKPYGVRVHSVITGGVNTDIAQGGSQKFSTRYYSVDGYIDSLRELSGMCHKKGQSIPPNKYAEQVVSKILGRCDPGLNIYKGGRAYSLHLMGRYLPVFILEWCLAFHFKQLKVWRELRRRVKLAL